ncbi:hypothetical protein P7K49_009573 [Saguinus oedipus]|uniref:Uncharacterized protein n=1 Tax=Saguinus oedipus TaxID=9490 RepID=A0ABQ9VKR1_SAGOE|nr:hypothetical protein P7K49_009573 [Saguinus oedipus]
MARARGLGLLLALLLPVVSASVPGTVVQLNKAALSYEGRMRKLRPKEGQKLPRSMMPAQKMFIHLELPLGENVGSHQSWEIRSCFPQGQTKLRLQGEKVRSDSRWDFQRPRTRQWLREVAGPHPWV